MNWFIDTVYYIVPFIVLLGILVFVHEFGHYIVAKLCGVKVDEFSIGFGKELWGFQDKSGTHWKISAVPLGGYCKFYGDADASSSTQDEAVNAMSEADKKIAFPFQNPFKKLAIVVAGPMANYLFAFLIFTTIFFFLGKFSFPPVVGEVIKGSAAEMMKIKSGDRIEVINGKKINAFDDIVREIALVPDAKVTLEILRGEEKIFLTFPLKAIKTQGKNGVEQERVMLGIRSVNNVEVNHHKLSIFAAVKEGAYECWNLTETTLRGVAQMITGKRGGDEVGGILRIAEMSGDISKQEGALNFVVFMALLSVNLGLINLFPIPVLDGGHIVIYIIEIVIGREIGVKIKDALFKMGFSLIMALMLFATWNDVVRLFNRWFS